MYKSEYIKLANRNDYMLAGQYNHHNYFYNGYGHFTQPQYYSGGQNFGNSPDNQYGNYGDYHQSYNSYNINNKNLDAKMLFHNPLQQEGEPFYQHNYKNNPNHYPHNYYVGNPPSGMGTIMNSFKNNDGTIDFNKMINTAGSMMNAVTQMSSVIKGVTSMFTK